MILNHWIVTGLLTLFVFSAAAMRCEGKLVSEQTQTIVVENLCGKPLNKHRFIDYQWIPVKRKKNIEFLMIPVEKEQWLYDFGPNVFQRLLEFENGNLIRIRTLGYGSE